MTQEEVAAYVGSTGLSIGPHLRCEIVRGGAKMNRLAAKVPIGVALSRSDVVPVAAEKLRIDDLLSAHPLQPATLALPPRRGA